MTNEEVVRAWKAGRTLPSIAAERGVTRQRILQIVQQAGEWEPRPLKQEDKRVLLERGLPVDRPADGCWEWTGYRHPQGYGRLVRGMWAHRVAHEVFVGPIPDGLGIMHSCDNPPCCNPRHLRPGTQMENIAERERKGRGRYGPNAPHKQRENQ